MIDTSVAERAETFPARPAALRSSRARLGLPLRRRPPLWAEAVAVGWLLWIYDSITNLSPPRATAALHHAKSVLHFEAVLHISWEGAANRSISSHPLLALVVADFYDNAHFVVTFGVLAWLWIVRPDEYRRWRTVLVLINLIGFAVFLVYPMAPPRMLPGFVDTVAASHAIGSWHSGALAASADQFAAMPSLHVAWAVWSALALWSSARRRPLQVAAALHPLVTFFAVIATANHLTIDSAAGVATAALAARVGPALTSRRTPRQQHPGTSQPGADTKGCGVGARPATSGGDATAARTTANRATGTRAAGASE